MRLLPHILAAILLAAGPARLGAAVVDAEFDSIRDTAVADLFSHALQPAADPAAGAPAAHPDLTALKRVVVSWNGVKSPPIIRYIGLPSEATVAPIAHGMEGTETPVGLAWPLPNLRGFWVAIAGPDDLIVTTPAQLSRLKPTPEPQPSGHAMRFIGPATDLKLGDLQQSLRCFTMTYDADGSTKAVLFANNEVDARHVDRYIWWRKPLVFAGADIGIRKLKFPARLLDQTDITRDKDMLVATTSLHDDLRIEAFKELADQISRELRNFQPRN